ncbi:hypothetical protein [Shouchella lehensis]|uniref:Uncharacterized protein n=1 Tax=Shouchella lehensis TaxID=300825 RepID=A0A4Y7WI84_9BACI|nr:hypothetical protein [Shouchella lehensis]MBG9785616.1 hypothetical protein [Shouchella lehensis]TES48069.1 hypothetical protein E2L03_13115 [Shouchella lehensis]
MTKEKGAKISNFTSKTNKTFWKKWEKNKFWVCIFISCIPVFLFYSGYISHSKDNTGNFIAYSVGILTVQGVFLTLLVTLKSSPVMSRLRDFFPHLHNYLYFELRKQISACIYFILINLAFAVFVPINNKYLVFFAIVMWSYYMVYITIGILYSIRTVMNLATSDIDTRSKMK